MSSDTLYTYYLVEAENMPRQFDIQVCDSLDDVRLVLDALDVHLDDDTIPLARVTIQGIGLTTQEFTDFLTSHKLPEHIHMALHPIVTPEDIWDTMVKAPVYGLQMENYRKILKSSGVKAMRYYTRLMLEYQDSLEDKVTPEFMLDKALGNLSRTSGQSLPEIREAVLNAMRMYKRNETIKLRRRIEELETHIRHLETDKI